MPGPVFEVADPTTDLGAVNREFLQSYTHFVTYSFFADWPTFVAYANIAPRPLFVLLDINATVPDDGGTPWDLGAKGVTFSGGSTAQQLSFDDNAQVNWEAFDAFLNVSLVGTGPSRNGLVSNTGGVNCLFEGSCRNKPIVLTQTGGAPLLLFSQPVMVRLRNAYVVNDSAGPVVGNGSDNNLNLVLDAGAQNDPFTFNIANPVAVELLTNNDVTAWNMTDQTWSTPSVSSRTIDTVVSTVDDEVMQVATKFQFMSTTGSVTTKVQPPHFPYDGQEIWFCDLDGSWGTVAGTLDGTSLPGGQLIQDAGSFAFGATFTSAKPWTILHYKYLAFDNNWHFLSWVHQ